MINVVLVRHAKSDWSDPSLADHDRALNARGRRNAPAMAAWFAKSHPRIERIISSTALRAATTAQVFGEALGLAVNLDAELYNASAETLMHKASNSGASSVMLVGHDPGITVLAERLSRGSIAHMPTCAVASFIWNETDWQEFGYGTVSSWDFTTPRDIAS